MEGGRGPDDDACGRAAAHRHAAARYLELSRSKKASWGRSMRPTRFILRFDSFWFWRCLSLRS